MTRFFSSRLPLRFFITLLAGLLLLGVGASSATVSRDQESFEVSRQRLLAYLLSRHLVQNHYRDRAFDDQLSAAGFKLYLQQLDSQKRFLLHGDVERLRVFEERIDDEMQTGYLQFPLVAAALYRRRIDGTDRLVQGIFAKGFDFRRGETLQVDPDKLAYCDTVEELSERWRKALKYQVMNRYLELLEERDGSVSGSASIPADYQLDGELLGSAVEKVRKSMEQLFSRLRKITDREYVDRYFDAVCRAFDPHTNYLAPAEEEEFEISMKGSLEGIGATLQQVDGFIKVVSIVPGSPAARQGQLQAEDIILQVAEGREEPVDIVDARLQDAVRLIRGKKGTEVRLTVRKPGGLQRVIPIVRDVVQIQESFVRATRLPGPPGRGGAYGYIRIPTFYRDFFADDSSAAPRNCTDDVARALTELAAHKLDGLVIDLRNNGGGALTDAVQIAGLFIEQGPVVQVRDSSGRVTILEDPDPAVAYDGELVVLVNRFSASASEILAAALQDYRRALVVGDHATHGKGTVQTVLNLDRVLPPDSSDPYRPLGAMKLTLQKFYRVNGGSTQVQGVEPDLVLPDPLPLVESGERYAEYALPWDTISPVSYTPWQAEGFDLQKLRAASRSRLEASARFQVLNDLHEQSRARGADTERSLRLADLWRELNAAKVARQSDSTLQDGAAPQTGEPAPASWEKEVENDLFVGEALQILADMKDAALPHQGLAHSPKASR